MAVALSTGNRVAKTRQARSDATHRNARDAMDIRVRRRRRARGSEGVGGARVDPYTYSFVLTASPEIRG
jgi:hypothetical protein